jgi:hypothetical protein
VDIDIRFGFARMIARRKEARLHPPDRPGRATMSKPQRVPAPGLDLHDEHVYLTRLLERLAEEYSSEQFTAATLADELSVLLVELDRHFLAEEQGGYFAEILESAPRFEKHIQALVEQHQKFLADVKNMQQMCYESMWGLSRFEDLRDSFHKFILEFQQHEHVERQLFQETMNM